MFDALLHILGCNATAPRWCHSGGRLELFVGLSSTTLASAYTTAEAAAFADAGVADATRAPVHARRRYGARDQTLVRSVTPGVRRVSQHPGSNCEGRRPGARPLAGIPASQASALNRANRYTFSDRRKVSIAENRARLGTPSACAWTRSGHSFARIPAPARASSTAQRPGDFCKSPHRGICRRASTVHFHTSWPQDGCTYRSGAREVLGNRR